MIGLTVFEFIALSIATFRLSRLIVFDTITTFIRKPFHELIEETSPDGTIETYLHIKGTGLRYWIGELLSCYWCVGIWAAIILSSLYQLFPFVMEPVVLILALAGVASLIEVIVTKLS